MPTRRSFIGGAASAAMLSAARSARGNAQGAIAPDWHDLAGSYHAPEWFRDAKFGIWAHWGPQCQPEYGDWYARNMYIEGHKQYKYHLEKYGHPSKFGFKDGSAAAGHLQEAVVRPTLEIILTEAPGHLRKRMDADVGIALIDPRI